MNGGADSRLLALLADVMGLLDLAELRQGLLDAMARAIPCDYVSLNEIAPSPNDVISFAHPPLPEHFVEAFARYAHENPLVQRFIATLDGRPHRFSDVSTREQLEATSLYREVYRPLGVRHQIAFTVPAAPGRFVGIALSRGDPDFTDAERDLLAAARPYLIQVYRNAIAYTLQRDALSAGAAPEQMARALRHAGVTGRQAEVVGLVAVGRSNREVAALLAISERTVQKHLERAYASLGVRTRAGAGMRAWDLVRETIVDAATPSLRGG